MTRAKPTISGTWAKIARKHYRHIDGKEVRYDCNAWAWEVIGGANDGYMYKTLNVAQHAAIM